MRNFKNSFDPC